MDILLTEAETKPMHPLGGGHWLKEIRLAARVSL